jgi:hypothetical protein
LLLQTGELVAALDRERPSGRRTTNHGKSLAARGDPARGLTSARQATLAVAGSQTGSRNGYIEHELLFCKIVWGVISPLLANVDRHDGLDVWFEHEVQPRLKGRAFRIRDADDFVMGFTWEEDARRVLDVLPKRFGRYGLAIHPDQTRLRAFPPSDRSDRSDSSVGSEPGTFDFLDFTHCGGRSRTGVWVVKRRTASSRLQRAIGQIAHWCRFNRHHPLPEQHHTRGHQLRGH